MNAARETRAAAGPSLIDFVKKLATHPERYVVQPAGARKAVDMNIMFPVKHPQFGGLPTHQAKPIPAPPIDPSMS